MFRGYPLPLLQADESAPTVGRLNLQRQASAEVELADRDFEFGQGADRLLPFADGEDPHAGTQASLECGAAGDHLVDLNDTADTVLSRGALADAEP